MPDDPKPIVYLSGSAGAKDWDEALFTKLTGSKFRCFSYAYVGENAPMFSRKHLEGLQWCLNNGVRAFLDSGAHSFHNFRYRGRGKASKIGKADRAAFVDNMMQSFLEEYCRWLHDAYKKQMHFDFFVTFDAEKRCQLIWDYTNEMRKRGVYPVPVYHGDAPITWLKRYIDAGHKLIGVGIKRDGKVGQQGRRRYLDAVFNLCEKNNVACHGFAVTGDRMFSYNWHSVDSTTYLKAAAYGKILVIMPEKERVCQLHVSETAVKGGYGTIDALPPSIMKFMRDTVEKQGFDFDRMRKETSYRALYNARVFVQAIERHSKKPLQWQAWQPVLG